ncbi:uncharacterized protein LOC144902448 [Branchiostoma floridae x Branchiostoma belcheri]
MLAGCVLVLVLVTSSVAYRDQDEYDRNSLRETFIDFSIEIPGNSKECFYQDLDERALGMYLQYIVLYQKNQDDLHLTVSGPDGKRLLHAFGEYDDFQVKFTDSEQRGTYEMCFENQHLLEETVVYVELYVEYESMWGMILASAHHDKLRNVTTSLKKISDRVQRMDLHAGLISQWYHKDSLTLKFSNKNIDNFGMLICALIIGSGLLQAFFIKKLFLRAQEELRSDPPVLSEQPRKASNSRLA